MTTTTETHASTSTEERAKHDAIRSLILCIRLELCATFFQRYEEIDGLITAALAREHVLLLGPPGTAKSDLTRAFASRLEGSNYFDWLLSKFTQPEELFGPVSIAGLKQDTFERVTAGKLPTAHVAFLDEIFKANSPILNALLTVANERRFHNGTRVDSLPTRVIVGASNELPSDESLEAFFDRFLVRHWVNPIVGKDDWRALMERDGDTPDTVTTLSLADWDAACDAAARVKVGEMATEPAYALKMQLEKEGITCSDRRWRKAFKLARAAAYLDEADEVEPEHMRVWQHVLWSEPDQRTKVAELVGGMSAPQLTKAQEVYDALIGKLSEVEQLEGDEFEARAARVNADARRALKRIEQSYKECKGKSSKRKIGELGRDMKKRAKAIRERLIRAGEVDEVGF